MCGIAGVWSGQRAAELPELVRAMTERLAHRGPDAAGYWQDAEAGIALGHRRLSILELSEAGAQPMESASGRWLLTFNGEIYNHRDLRHRLEAEGSAPAWRGSSDTETLLAAVEAWGVDPTIKAASGMLALALWDRQEHCLWLARDRFGEKPLYLGWHQGAFLFGSELKAIRAFPGFNAPLNPEALGLYLQYSAVPAPFSIYQGIHKLLPGHWLRLSRAHLEAGELPPSTSYWSADVTARAAMNNPFQGSAEEGVDALEELLSDAIGRQMVADVRVGAFLSGGIDSSTVVALMQARSSRPVRTFSIGFREEGYNEAEHARAVAAHLGTDHAELYVTPAEAMAVIPELPGIYDEPFADSSQIPTLLVSRMTRQQVTVALSGDAGDELFAGYRRYFSGVWDRIKPYPPWLRRLVSRFIFSVPVRGWNRAMSPLRLLGRDGVTGDWLHRAAEFLDSTSGQELYRRALSHWRPAQLMPSLGPLPGFGPQRDPGGLDLIQMMMLEDTCHYLPDDILVKIDRAAMAASLEVRVPMLDPRVFELAWRLPMAMKVRAGQGKWALRQVLYRHVPQALVDRPKMGFGVPIGAWLRGPLRDWAESLLAEDRLHREGYLNPEPIRRRWAEHLSGRRNWQYHLWDVLMFQAWLEGESQS